MLDPPLTRKAEVLKVLEAGGYVVDSRYSGCVTLYSGTNLPVNAWQQAIKANLARCEVTTDERRGRTVWKLKA